MVSIRVMWNSEAEKKDAEYVVNRIVKVFSSLKRWSCSKSRIYNNRKNSGGRIYINLWKR
ncbi:hypothetical protein [Methanothermococcus thermolithotrophicus]|uniref:hypothetical protein n=1 Tax=Methanothermococcus thermolithotrophicus TaxID=2186 RepID=UPI000367EBC5|nr:hypothetical protein [Methanothermococcus thermolithotrophicus]